ncbi:hypothetical protein RV12_GL000597 [Enterococcus quebecensis]|nr:hypothetical protein RV12_GL000597 [Enterococcus quebecensis]
MAQLIGAEQEVMITRNDDPDVFRLAKKATAIVLSPGPGTPKQTGHVREVIQQFHQQKPILGICLGHQTIGEVFGGQVVLAKEIRHGKQSEVTINENNRLFRGITKKIAVMRYHSLVIKQQSLPKDFMITAITDDDQEIMAIEHRDHPIFGLQFHPESIGTPDGAMMIKNFIQLTEDYRNGKII